MSTVEEILVRYTAQDDLSAVTRRARGEVDALIRSLQQLGRMTVDPKVQLTGLAGASGRVAQQLQQQTAAQGAAGQSLGQLSQATRDYNGVLSTTVRAGFQFTSWLGTEVIRASRDGALALGALGTAAAAMGLKAAGGFQMAQTALGGITGSQAMGSQLMNWTVGENLRTVFTQADIQRSLQTELALAVPVNAARPQLQAAENLTAATGNLGNLPEVVMALSKVTAGGHMTGREFNQLAANGVPIAQIISENTGMTTGDVVGAAHGGTLDVKASDFQQWLATNSGPTLSRLGANGGLAHVMNETLLGQASTAKDAALQALRGGIQPELPQMTQGIEQFSKALDPFLAHEGPVLGDIVLRLEHFLTATLPAVAPVADAFFRGIDHVLAQDYSHSGLLALGQDTGKSITGLFNTLADEGPTFAQSLVTAGRIIPGMVSDLNALMPLFKVASQVLNAAMSIPGGAQVLGAGVLGTAAMRGFSGVTGGAGPMLLQYAMMRKMGLTGGAASGATAAGRMATVGGIARKVGGAGMIAGGALGEYESLTKPGGFSWGGLGSSAASGASVGFGVGAVGGLGVFDEISIPVMTAGGAILGAGAYGVKSLFGHHTSHTDNSVHLANGAVQVNGPAGGVMTPEQQRAWQDTVARAIQQAMADRQRRNGGGS